MCKIEFLLCPVCGSKTRIKLRPDTVLENFPLFCPKCKQESLITVRKLHTTVITEPITRSGSEKKRAAAISDFQAQLPVWELRFSFGDFDFLRYNEKKVVRLEHHFLSYRVKGPLEHRKEVLPWKIAEL